MPKLPSWDDVKRAAEDVEKKVQSAGATAREKWNQQVRPKLSEIQKKLEETGQRASDSLQEQVIALNDALGKFQRELAEDLKIGRKPPEKPPEKKEE
jgi:dsDNA-specific endonuclease/ATPase MutS2